MQAFRGGQFVVFEAESEDDEEAIEAVEDAAQDAEDVETARSSGQFGIRPATPEGGCGGCSSDPITVDKLGSIAAEAFAWLLVIFGLAWLLDRIGI